MMLGAATLPRMLPIEWNRCELVLLRQRCAYLPAIDTLLLGDAHFGKAATFRAAGIPVPRGTTAQTLSRLDEAVERTGAGRVIILGDLLHARSGRVPEVLDALRAWRRARRNLELVLVRGNHDRHAGDPPPDLAVRCVAAPLVERVGDVTVHFHHEPPAAPPPPSAAAFAAHVHPVVVLRDRRDRLRLPCFAFGAAIGILPAFGAFTGGHAVRQADHPHIFAVTPDGVLDASRPPRRTPAARPAARPRRA